MLSVLVVSPHPSVPGGVSVFIECMKRHVTQTRVASFFIGSSGRGRESLGSVLWRLISAPVILAWRVRRSRYDVVHINPSLDIKSLIRDGLFLWGLRAVGFRRTLVYFHGWDAGVFKRMQSSSFLSGLLARTLRYAALITVLDSRFKEDLVSVGIDGDRVVVTRTMFEGRELSFSAPEKNGSRPFVLFMSRFDREKGGRDLVRAFINLAQSYPMVDLVMAGTGEDDLYLRALAKNSTCPDRIRFTGYIGGAEKWRLLSACTIFALPTTYRSEGMPVAVLEAMGAGKPLLVGPAGAMRSIVGDPANGVLLDQVTPQSVGYGLRRLLDDPVLSAQAGARNKEVAWARFEAQPVTAEIEAFYKRVAEC